MPVAVATSLPAYRDRDEEKFYAQQHQDFQPSKEFVDQTRNEAAPSPRIQIIRPVGYSSTPGLKAVLDEPTGIFPFSLEEASSSTPYRTSASAKSAFKFSPPETTPNAFDVEDDTMLCDEDSADPTYSMSMSPEEASAHDIRTLTRQMERQYLQDQEDKGTEILRLNSTTSVLRPAALEKLQAMYRNKQTMNMTGSTVRVRPTIVPRRRFTHRRPVLPMNRTTKPKDAADEIARNLVAWSEKVQPSSAAAPARKRRFVSQFPALSDLTGGMMPIMHTNVPLTPIHRRRDSLDMPVRIPQSSPVEDSLLFDMDMEEDIDFNSMLS
jgi:hypothetical protein